MTDLHVQSALHENFLDFLDLLGAMQKSANWEEIRGKDVKHRNCIKIYMIGLQIQGQMRYLPSLPLIFT